jgi:hypothetical protein
MQIQSTALKDRLLSNTLSSPDLEATKLIQFHSKLLLGDGFLEQGI